MAEGGSDARAEAGERPPGRGIPKTEIRRGQGPVQWEKHFPSFPPQWWTWTSRT